jgi:DNA-binding Lrp family transcriptional regulator
MALDRLDGEILDVLLKDGRISALDLSRSIGLSATACARRIKRLEDAGVLSGYQAKVDLDRLGFQATVIVTIQLQNQTEDALTSFERAVAQCPSVLWCCLMSGMSDYVASVAAKDIRDYERIHKDELSRLPGVVSLHSSFVLREVVKRPAPEHLRLTLGPLPLPSRR